MDHFKLACFAVVVISRSYCEPMLDTKAAEGSQPNDFGQGQQLQGGQVAYDPSFSIDQAALQFQNTQRLAGNSFYPAGGQQGGGNQAGVQQQPQQNQQQWTGDLADLSQVLTQNVVAQQVQQLQQGQPDPLAASPYHTLLKNLAGTAPLYPPAAPGQPAPQQDPRFPGQIIQGGGLEGGSEVERLDPQGPPHPPLNVENANYLTAVASIPQRIGPIGFNPPNLPAAFPHQTFLPNTNYMNRGQQAPPSFNPWPANLQGAQQQQQAQQSQQQQQLQHQQQQQQFVQQQQNFHAQFRPVNNNPAAQRHPAQFGRAASSFEMLSQSQSSSERNPIIVDVSQNSSTSNNSNNVNKTESEEILKNYLTQQIQDLKIVSYGQTLCKVCDETDKILRNNKLPVHSFLTDTMTRGKEILQILQRQTAAKEIPYVFICGHYVGGYKKVQDLNKQDELKNLMKRCNN